MSTGPESSRSAADTNLIRQRAKSSGRAEPINGPITQEARSSTLTEPFFQMGKETGIPGDKLELYEKLVGTNPEVERKGAAMPYTSVNGHMFSFLTKTGTLALRLPTEERAMFLKKYKTRLCEQHGKVLEEYVEVPNGLLKRTPQLKNYFDLSYAYVATLKPKATKIRPGKRQST